MLVRLVLIEEAEGENINDPSGVVNQPYRKINVSSIFVNSKNVVMLKDDYEFIKHNIKKRLPENLPKDQKFTRVFLVSSNHKKDFTVVGDIELIALKLNGEYNGN